ncbi:MAG: hypothetical protein OEU36_15565 [Gammaproteobacteria bacterium]|nr:hypothetical protein [Gammaproteobacteria bacterium]
MKNAIVLLVLVAAGYFVWDKYLRGVGDGPVMSHDDIIVYSSEGCSPCLKMINMLERENVSVIVRTVDDDDKAKVELRNKLDAIGFKQQLYKLPVVDIYGQVFPDNPSRKKVKAALP